MSSRRKIDGAWVGLLHWSEREGARWNAELAEFTAADWRDLVAGMHALQMDYIVIQECFRNQEYAGRHHIRIRGYRGRAFYPSSLYSRRMGLPDTDPVETILAAADGYRMRVFLGVGLYAWFDFSPGSLRWHQAVMTELWSRYGHHPSLYGWYISEEVVGGIVPQMPRWWPEGHKQRRIARYREEIVTFFRSLRQHCDQHGGGAAKPLMLAPNCHFMRQAEATWRALLQHCQIVCPFGFNRMPRGDVGGAEVAAWLQGLCRDVGAHLWLDMEVFLFGPQGELIPRPIDQIAAEIAQSSDFETILCYQYPGLFNAPTAHRQPGGPATVALFEQYTRYLADSHIDIKP